MLTMQVKKSRIGKEPIRYKAEKIQNGLFEHKIESLKESIQQFKSLEESIQQFIRLATS